MKYCICIAVCAAFLFTVNGQNSKPLYAFYDRWSQLKGYWSDSIIYSTEGQPLHDVRGKAIVSDSGKIVYWTDLNGSFFDLDGQLLYFSRLLKDTEKDAIKLKETERAVLVPASANLFEPLFCYDFLPLEKEEIRAINNVLLRLREEAYLKKQVDYENAGIGYSAFVQKVAGKDNVRLNDQLSDYRERSRQAALSTQLRNKQLADSGWIRTDRFLLFRPGTPVMQQGVPYTQKDNLLYRLRQKGLSFQSVPAEVFVYFYNPLNDEVVKAFNDYAYARACFDSANAYYSGGEYMTAFQWCLLGTKKRKQYTNAYVMAAACMRELENYEAALDYIDRVEDPACKWYKEVLKADIYLKQGIKSRAAACLRSARKTQAEEWAEYIREKYAFKD